MVFTKDQKRPAEPRGSILHTSSGQSPDVTVSNAIQAWHERTLMVASLLTQIASGYLIVSYDPSHSASQELPQVSLTQKPNHHAFTDFQATMYPWAGLSTTRLDPRSLACNIHASMPYLRFHNRSILQITPERPVPIPLPDICSRSCYLLGLCQHWNNEKLAAPFYNCCSGLEPFHTLHISLLKSREARSTWT